MKGLRSAPVRITDDETGEWIEIKAVLSQGDADWLNDQIYHFSAETQEMRTLARETVLLKCAVTGWHLLDEAGKEFPFSKAAIAELPNEIEGKKPELIDRVLGEIAARNPLLGRPLN